MEDRANDIRVGNRIIGWIVMTQVWEGMMDDHRYRHRDKHIVLRADSNTTSIQKADYSEVGDGGMWGEFMEPVFSDPTDEELSEFFKQLKSLVQAYEEEQ